MASWMVIAIVMVGAVLVGVGVMGVVTLIEAGRSRRHNEAMPKG